MELVEKRAKAAEYMREYRLVNGDKLRTYDKLRWSNLTPEQKREKMAGMRLWVQRNPEKRKLIRAYHAIRKYGISPEILEQMIAEQDNRCAICCNPQIASASRLAIDHDHKTDEVRGLLCNPCNTLLGMANDNVEVLEAAIAYLKSFRRVHLEAVS